VTGETGRSEESNSRPLASDKCCSIAYAGVSLLRLAPHSIRMALPAVSTPDSSPRIRATLRVSRNTMWPARISPRGT
jgi:hypothetical protein